MYRVTLPTANRTVAVTGGTGFIGRHCVAQLASAGWRVVLLNRSPLTDMPSGVAAAAVDLFDYGAVTAALESVRPTHLLHLAWETTPGKFWRSPLNLEWLASSLNILKAFVRYGGRRAVLAGTCAEYEWAHGDGICREARTPLHPGTLYGECKNALRAVGERYALEAGFSFAWGRVFSPYGPGEPPEKLVAAVIRDLLAGRPTRCTAGEQVRDYIYVADLADAFVRLLESDTQGAINLASGQAIRVADLVRLAADVIGRQELARFGDLDASSNDPSVLVADVTRLNAELGWRPSTGLKEGLERAAKWWRIAATNNANTATPHPSTNSPIQECVRTA